MLEIFLVERNLKKWVQTPNLRFSAVNETAPKVLQQMWRCEKTMEIQWRNVPTHYQCLENP